MKTRSRYDITDALLLIGALLILYLLSQKAFGSEIRAHTRDGARERCISFSELLIVIPDGQIRLVFWHQEDGVFDTEQEAIDFVLKYKQIRFATKTESKMFYELYDYKTIRKHAQLYARRSYSYEGRLIEILPKCFAVVYKPP